MMLRPITVLTFVSGTSDHLKLLPNDDCPAIARGALVLSIIQGNGAHAAGLILIQQQFVDPLT